MTPEELQRHLELARPALAPAWNEERSARAEAGLPARARAQRRSRVLSVAVAGLLVVGAASLGWRTRTPDVELTPSVAAIIVPLPSTDGPRYSLSAGEVRFKVKRGGAPVRVVAGVVEVSVQGTRFLVERMDTQVQVVVEEGSAEVRWPGGARTLSSGEGDWFPPVEAAVVPPPAVPAQHEASAARSDGAPVAPVPLVAEPKRPKVKPVSVTPAPNTTPDWKQLATDGDFSRAWDAMKAAPAPRDETAELLLAADVARLSGHPDAAVAPLEQVVRHHASDARAPLAAFTLGRVLLDDLGRPREAATAFESARTLAPSSRLAEDALARQVEAASRAQDPQTRALAESFLKLYPASPRLRAVRHFGGLGQ